MILRKLVIGALVLLVVVSCRDKKDNTDKKDVKKKKDDKDGSEDEKSSPSKTTTSEEDDYDTTQGYPILYPETHMMSQLKRNVTNASNETSLNDDKDGVKQKNRTSGIMENNGKCTKSVDLLFVLDSSESVKYSNWKIVIEFVKELADRFTLNAARVGIIRYASEAEVALPLTRFNDTDSRNRAIDDIFYKTGGTRTDIALKKAAEVLHAEDQRSQVLMLVTDGPTNRLEINKDHFVEGKDLVAGPAYKLKQAGVALFTIGVEPDSETPEEVETMKDEMRVIASEPTKQHLFLSDGYHELERKVDYVSKAACVVNGGWSAWSEYSPCSVTCGFGTKVRMRTCTNPSPENNGADCTGVRVETEECDLGPCTVNDPPLNHAIQPIEKLKANESSDNSAVIVNSSSTIIKNATNAIKLESNSTNSSSTEPSKNARVINSTNEIQAKPTPIIGGCYEGLEEIALNDSQFNASSIYSHDTDDEYVKKEYAPPNARLNNMINGGGWCAEHKFAVSGDKNQYLQFDLGKQMTVDAIATQGSHLLDNWVTSYNLRFSDDAMSWEYYAQNPLEGNKNRADVKKHFLNPPIVARYIQVNPIEWNEQDSPDKRGICLRAGLFKCKDAPSAHQRRGITRSRVEYLHPHGEYLHPDHLRYEDGVVLREHESRVRSGVPSMGGNVMNHYLHPIILHHLQYLNNAHGFQNNEREIRQNIPQYRYSHHHHHNHHNNHRLHKRILSKVRKVAKHIMRKIRRPVKSFL